VTRTRTKIADETVSPEVQLDPDVRQAKGSPPLFNPQKEKETFLQARREFVTLDHGASTSTTHNSHKSSWNMGHVYGMPPIFDYSLLVAEKLSPLKYFLQIILSLFQDGKALAKLQSMIGKCNKEPVKLEIKIVKPTTEIVSPWLRKRNP